MQPVGYDGGCRGLSPRAGVTEPEPCARLVVLHHRRPRGRAERMMPRLGALADDSKPVRTRLRAASAFTRDLDSLFVDAKEVSSPRLHELVAAFDTVFHDQLLPGLARDGVTFVRPEDLPAMERERVRRCLGRSIQPLLTPMAIGATHPIPKVPALDLNLVVRVGHRLVYLTIPSTLPRTMAMRGGRYLPAESLVGAFLPEVLIDVPVAERSAFRITRSATDNRITRLEVERTASDELVDELASRVGVERPDVYPMRSSLAIGHVFAVPPTLAPTRRSRPAVRATRIGTETMA